MKNKTGVISGFIIGLAGFLLLFKFLILDRTSPEDELAPGIVVLAAIVVGLVCAYIGHWIQNYFRRERNN
jgi:hypothetical protein